MEKIVWKDSWSVGYSDLDNDHKRLLAIIQRIDEWTEGGFNLAELISDLEDYTRYHFDREEKMMEAADMSDLDAHKSEHSDFVDWLRTVRKSFSASPETQSVLHHEIRRYLNDWLVEHILKTDMSYKGKL